MSPAAIHTMRSEPMATESRPVTTPPVIEPAVLTAMIMPFQRLPWAGTNRVLMNAHTSSTMKTMYACPKM